ncbi:CPK2, partial [Symbiodinium sp. KB8]
APSQDESEAPETLLRNQSGFSRATAANIASEVMFPTHVGRLAIFDDYLFCGDVGSGSFGKVMLVRHKSTKQLRACKVVAVQTALQRELMDNEIRLLKSLNHPHIMKMHEVYFEQASESGQVASGNIYLVTELCEGGDLFSRILHHYERLKQPMTESHVAFMMQQILSATKYCHDKGIIHRDIKPENILFVDRSASSPLKIIDFGLANFHEKIREQAKEVKVARSGTMGRLARMLPSVNGRHLIPWHERKRVMQKAGTPHYMAPEMIEGSYDHKADLFSIGIILCQLFTGWHPFYTPGDDETAVRAKISNPDPVQFPTEIWAQVSHAACDLCRKLLEKQSSKRLSAAQALAHEWFRDPSKPSPFGNVEGLSVSIFDGLKQYQAYNKLKRAVLQLLTRELSEFQIQELRAKFMALDTHGDGLLSPEELVEGMRHVGYEMSEKELEQVMAALDGSGSQRIGYKEFISALIERRVKFDRQQLFECFKKFDKQGIGRITYQAPVFRMCLNLSPATAKIRKPERLRAKPSFRPWIPCRDLGVRGSNA